MVRCSVWGIKWSWQQRVVSQRDLILLFLTHYLSGAAKTDYIQAWSVMNFLEQWRWFKIASVFCCNFYFFFFPASLFLPLCHLLPCLYFFLSCCREKSVWLVVDILSAYEACVCVCVKSLIVVCIETSVISQCSLPCHPANNQHPLCACSFSLCLSSLSPSLPFLSPACCHNDKPHSAIVPHCSPRTKEEAISSLREKRWKWRIGIKKERKYYCEGGLMRVWERTGEQESECKKRERRSVPRHKGLNKGNVNF